jgi:hypothetical protein
MSKLARRQSLALSAVISSALLPAVGLGAPAAHAVNGGPADSALTISDGSQTLLIGDAPVTFPTTVTDATWSPKGSRLAYVAGNGDLVSALPDGTGIRVLAHGGPGIVISHPTWTGDGAGVAFAESVGGVFGPIEIARADGYGTSASGGGDGTAVVSDWSMRDGAAYASPDAVSIPNGTSPAATVVPDFVFQKTPAGGGTPEIWSLRNWADSVQQYKIATGTEPTVSPDGKTVAFIDQSFQLAVVDISDTSHPSAPKVLTHLDDLQLSHPTFSPDGTKIAFETSMIRMGAPSVPQDVRVIPATGGTPAVASPHPGVPAYRPTAVTHVTRLAGADRIGTAIAVSQARFPDGAQGGNRAGEVVIARSDQYADALAGSALARERNAPMLLTEPGALNPAVQAEMLRVLGPVDKANPQTVVLLGGPQALSPAIESSIQQLGYRTERFQGPDRYATSVAIAKAVANGSWPTKILVATGDNFADALSAGAVAEPIVLTDDKLMPPEVAAYLNYYGRKQTPNQVVATIYEVGGQAKTATENLWPPGTARPATVPLAGIDRFETSFLVAREFFGPDPAQPGHVHIGAATAYNWPDSLAGGAAMAQLQGPMLLVDPKTGLTPEERQWVSANSGDVDSALLFGGPAAVSPSVDAQLGSTLAGPAGYVTATNPPSIP